MATTTSIRAHLDVCLVQMPFAALSRPSIALGLLKRYLLDAEITSQAVYGNLEFAEALDGEVYRLVELFPQNALLGEWLFSPAAFPDFTSPDQDAYLEKYAGLLGSKKGPSAASRIFEVLRACYPDLDAKKLLLATRRRAVSYVDSLADRLLAAQPKIVGCTTMFQQNCASLALLRRLKERDPQIVTMLGGANCEGPMGAAAHRAFPWLDFVVSGEVDLYFGAFCKTILERGPELGEEELPYGVWGPVHRRSGKPASLDEGTPPAKDQRAIVEELDQVGVPEYDDYFRALDEIEVGNHITPGLVAESSRGCWWGAKKHCTFCGLNGSGMAFRAKSPERVVDELTGLADQWGIHRIQVVDNILDMRYFKNVVPQLAERDEPYSMFYEVKPNLRRDQLELLAKAGIRDLQPGIESMHSNVLALLNKGGSAVRNVQLLKWGDELGVRISWNFLFGAPDERDDWYEEMCSWLPTVFHLQPPGGTSRIRFDRFSPYHMRAEDYGLDLRPDHRYAIVYPLPEEELSELAYYFEDRNAVEEEVLTAGRPGLVALRALVGEWQQLHAAGLKRGEPPMLTARVEEDRIVLRDKRPIAATDRIELDGLSAEIYRRCEAAPSPEGLARSLGDAVGEEKLADAVAELQALKILLALEGRLVSLAIREPIAPQPSFEDLPGGTVDDIALIRTYRHRSFARHCVTSARDRSLRTLFSPVEA